MRDAGVGKERPEDAEDSSERRRSRVQGGGGVQGGGRPAGQPCGQGKKSHAQGVVIIALIKEALDAGMEFLWGWQSFRPSP